MIRLTDGTSHRPFVEIALTREQFATALFSREAECEFEWRPDCPVGKRREVKDELVFLPTSYGDERDEAKAAAIAPFEVDGWKAHADDLGNGHKRAKTDPKGVQLKDGAWYRVSFVRFVEADHA